MPSFLAASPCDMVAYSDTLTKLSPLAEVAATAAAALATVVPSVVS